MRYVIDVGEKEAAKVSELITEGKYNDVQQFLTTAITNQLYLEKADNGEASAVKEETSGIVALQEKEDTRLILKDVQLTSREIIEPAELLDIPEPEKLSYLYKGQDMRSQEDVWLWGQINRIFPIKLGLRVLYLLQIINGEKTVPIDDLRGKAADAALLFRKIIAKKEKEHQGSLDQKLSAGLPKDVNDEEYQRRIEHALRKQRRFKDMEAILQQEKFKSIERYKNQFLADIRNDGKYVGAMSWLKFAVPVTNPNGSTNVGLTGPGVEFAKLSNPIIDDNTYEESLSTEEIAFYLNHIKEYVKGEYRAITWMLNIISRGTTEREAINDAIGKEFNNVWKDSPKVINTQRAGLMGRMSELGLIGKDKEGVSVKYKVIKKGKDFLTKQ